MSSATGPYPTTKQFNEACLNPASAFVTSYLKTAKFRQFGPPLLRNFVLQGRFAAVSRAELADGRTLGIRFLKSSQPGLLKRYHTLPKVFIRSNIEDNTVAVVLKPKELILPSAKWDLIEMEWVNGQTLSTEVKRLLEQGDIRSIRALSEDLQKLAAKMASAEVSHGDISPENIMVNDGHLVLVDYDSFWSEELKTLPYNVGPSKLQHPKAPKNPGKLADRVAFSILKLGFSVLLNNPEKFASADGHLEQHRFVFDVDSLSKGDPSAGLIPESERQLYELLMSVLAGSYSRVEELDELLFPEIRLSNSWVTIRSITPRELKIPQARTKIVNAGIVVKRINNNDSISESDKERAIRALQSGQDAPQPSHVSSSGEIIHLVAIANEHSISLRSLRPRLNQVGVHIFSSPSEHILLDQWNLVKDAVTGTDLTDDLERVIQVSNDKEVETSQRPQKSAQSDQMNNKIKVLESHVAMAELFGLRNEKYRNVVRLLFPGRDLSTVSSESVKAKMISILPVGEWKYLRTYGQRRIRVTNEEISLNSLARTIGVDAKYLVANLLLEGVAYIENIDLVIPQNQLVHLLAEVGFVVEVRNVIDQTAIQLGIAKEQLLKIASSYGFSGDFNKIEGAQLGKFVTLLRAIDVDRYVYSSVSGRYLLLDPSVLRYSALANSLGISFHCLIVLLMVGGFKGNPTYWNRIVAIDSEFQASEIPNISAALGIKIMLGDPQQKAEKQSTSNFHAGQPSLHDAVAVELGLSKAKYLNVVQLLFPREELSTVSSESVKATMSSIYPIDQWKNLRGFSNRKLTIPDSYVSLNDFSNVLGASVPYLRALFLVEGVNYFYSVENSYFPLSQMKIWFEKIGVTVFASSKQMASSDSLQKTHFSSSTKSPSKPANSSLHDESFTSLGISKQNYSNVVRLLFPGQELSAVSSESVKAKMGSIFPIDRWKNLQKFRGQTLRIREPYLSIDDAARAMGVLPSYVKALLIYEGIELVDFTNGQFPISEIRPWLQSIGIYIYIPTTNPTNSSKIDYASQFKDKPDPMIDNKPVINSVIENKPVKKRRWWHLN